MTTQGVAPAAFIHQPIQIDKEVFKAADLIYLMSEGRMFRVLSDHLPNDLELHLKVSTFVAELIMMLVDLYVKYNMEEAAFENKKVWVLTPPAQPLKKLKTSGSSSPLVKRKFKFKTNSNSVKVNKIDLFHNELNKRLAQKIKLKPTERKEIKGFKLGKSLEMIEQENKPESKNQTQVKTEFFSLNLPLQIVLESEKQEITVSSKEVNKLDKSAIKPKKMINLKVRSVGTQDFLSQIQARAELNVVELPKKESLSEFSSLVNQMSSRILNLSQRVIEQAPSSDDDEWKDTSNSLIKEAVQVDDHIMALGTSSLTVAEEKQPVILEEKVEGVDSNISNNLEEVFPMDVSALVASRLMSMRRAMEKQAEEDEEELELEVM